jgi:thiopurine S-methyltransferase
MIHSFWQERWDEGLTGFNQPQANQALQEYWPGLDLPQAARVLVPLCGKSCDMLWLRSQGHAVVGVEFVGLAVEEFFAENNIASEPTALGRRACDGGPPLSLIQGDFMGLQAQQVGPIDAFYDRASIVALSDDLQVSFARALAALTGPGTVGLMLGFEYPQDQRQGPPFSTSAERMQELLGDAFTLRQLERQALPPATLERFGVDSCFETVHKLRRG